MNLIKVAVAERTKQLTRKMNAESNTAIREIIQKEIDGLQAELHAQMAKK